MPLRKVAVMAAEATAAEATAVVIMAVGIMAAITVGISVVAISAAVPTSVMGATSAEDRQACIRLRVRVSAAIMLSLPTI